MSIEFSKRCSRCKETKVAACFSKSTRNKHGLRHWCKPCCVDANRKYDQTPARKERFREWNLKNAEKNKHYHRNQHLKRKYGITHEQYEGLLTSQGGLCDMCHKPETASNGSGVPRRLVVDHCHETGLIRGLLCLACNVVTRPDDIEFLQMRIDYLKRHRKENAPQENLKPEAQAVERVN